MNQLPSEDLDLDEMFYSDYPEQRPLNNFSLRAQTKFNRPIITQKRKPKTRTKRFYTEDELNTYKQKDLLRIATFNNIKYPKKEQQKQKIIELLLNKPIQIPHLTELEETEKQENVLSFALEAQKRNQEVKQKINELIANKEIQTEEKFMKAFETDKRIYEISNFNRKRIYNKKLQKYNKPSLIKEDNFNTGVIIDNKKIKIYVPSFIANNFIRKMKENETAYHIDNDKKNNNVNNLIILTRSEVLISKNTGKGEKKGKTASIVKEKSTNNYTLRYSVNKNIFGRTFTTEEEALRAKQEYMEKIDDIENPFNALSVLDLSFHSGKTLKKVEI